jgi:flagellar capping protein FliD
MSTLSISGLISNLDTDSIINSLVEVEMAPALLLEGKQQKYNKELEALQQLNARMLGINTSAQALSRRSTFNAKKITSSDNTVLTATGTSAAAAGNHSVEVLTLAQAQSITGGTFDSMYDALELEGSFRIDGNEVTIESGDSLATIATRINSNASTVRASIIEIEEGQYQLTVSRREAGAAGMEIFAADSTNILQDLGLVDTTTSLANPDGDAALSGAYTSETDALGSLLNLESPAPAGAVQIDDGSGPISVAINLETDSLQSIADAINAEATAQGSSISASIESEEIGDQSIYRLRIEGAGPITATDDNNVLQNIGLLQPDLANEVKAGQDATLVVDGVNITRSGNLITGVIPGVSLYLNSADPGNPVNLIIGENSEPAMKAVQNFVESYNQSRMFILEQTAFDPETLQKGVLLSNSAVRSVESSMFSILGTRVAKILTQDLRELNNGTGADAGRISITDRSGASAEIDLTSATSVQDVVDAINRSQDISVTASANSAGDGIVLKDTSNGVGTFEVSDVGGSTTAADFGLAQSINNNTIRGDAVGEEGFYSLVDIGVSSADNGTLSLDAGKLNQMLSENPKAVERLFTATGVGVGRVAAKKTEFITRSQGGTISNRTQSIQNIMDDIQDRLEEAERRAVRLEERLQRKFADLEMTLAEFQSQADFLNDQLLNLGNVFNGSQK